jgi:hypothetical protein
MAMRPDEPSDEDLVLYHYGEAPDAAAVEAQLAASPAAARRLADLRRALAAAEDEWAVPAPGPLYEAELWLRLRPRLAAARREQPVALAASRFRARARRWLPAAAAAALLLAVGYLAGRLASRATPPAAPLTAESRQRLLVDTLAEHLERSERLFTELENLAAADPGALAGERQAAEELLADNRLYRVAAEQGGREGIAALLAELEPVLLELAHAPAEPQPADVELLRSRIESRGLLFKTRVASDLLRRTLLPPPSRSPNA